MSDSSYAVLLGPIFGEGAYAPPRGRLECLSTNGDHNAPDPDPLPHRGGGRRNTPTLILPLEGEEKTNND